MTPCGQLRIDTADGLAGIELHHVEIVVGPFLARAVCACGDEFHCCHSVTDAANVERSGECVSNVPTKQFLPMSTYLF